GRYGPCVRDRGSGRLAAAGWRTVEGARGLVSAVSRLLSLLPGSAPGIPCTRGVHRCNPSTGQGQKEALIDNARTSAASAPGTEGGRSLQAVCRRPCRRAPVVFSAAGLPAAPPRPVRTS